MGNLLDAGIRDENGPHGPLREQPANTNTPTAPAAAAPATPAPAVPTPTTPTPTTPAPTTPATPAPSAPEETAGLSDIAERMLNMSSEDIDYLRGEPYSTDQEQAMRARMQDRVRGEYGTARQRMMDTLGARQGMSGVLIGALGKLDDQEAAAMSAVDRDIMIRSADEMRSRLGESRGIIGGLEGLERQRQMESLGLEQMTDASERERLMDLMSALGLAPNPASAANIYGGSLQYAQGLGQSARDQAASNMQGIGGLAQLFQQMGWMGG